MRQLWILVLAAGWGFPDAGAWALSFQYEYLDSPGGTLASRGWFDPQSPFQRNIRAAADLWGAAFESDESIRVRIDASSFTVRAGGTFSLGRQLFVNEENRQVWEPGPLTRILTGTNPGADFFGYDIKIGFDVAFVERFYWFDPAPETRTTPVPADRGDFLSVVLHELAHGWGVAGFRDFSTSNIVDNVVTTFDERSYFGGDGNPRDPQGAPQRMFFDGPQASALHGGDLPLTHKPAGDRSFSQNFYHLSACDPLAPDGLEETLLNGCVLPNGGRLHITQTDLAVMADLGYPLASNTTLRADFDENGNVDAADLQAWTSSWAVDGGADADGNEVSDGVDFLIWQQEFGSILLLVAAPEPSSAAISLAAWLACMATSRGRGARVHSSPARKRQAGEG